MGKRERKNVELYTGKPESPSVFPQEETGLVSPNDTAGIDDERSQEYETSGTVEGTPPATPVSNDISVIFDGNVKERRNIMVGKTAKTDKNDKTKKRSTEGAPDASSTKSSSFHVQIPETVKPVILEIQLRRLVATGVKHTIAEIITEAVYHYHNNI